MVFSINEITSYNENVTLIIYMEKITGGGFQSRSVMFRKTFNVGYQNNDNIVNKEKKKLETILSVIKTTNKKQVEEHIDSLDKDIKFIAELKLGHMNVSVLTYNSERQLKS